MGRKLRAFLSRRFKTSKLKTTANLAISRLSILKNQRTARLTIARSDVIQLLRLNHHDHALLRVEQVIKDQNMLDVYHMILEYCHLLIQMINLIEQAKYCPDELEEAVSSLIYAAPRCGEFPELQEIRAILTARFGKEFAEDSIELRSNCGVSKKMVEKLSPKESSLECRMKILTAIAKENGVDRVVLELEKYSPEIKKEKVVVEKKQTQPKTEAKVENLPEKMEKVLSFSLSMKTYRDAADAAQDAFESAAYAAAAARVAVELSRLESFASTERNKSERSQYDMKVVEFDSEFDSDGFSDVENEQTGFPSRNYGDAKQRLSRQQVSFGHQVHQKAGTRNSESRFD